MVDRSIVFHSVAATFHVYALLYPYFWGLPMPTQAGFAGRLKYLTVWSHVLQVSYYVFAVLLDLYSLYTGHMSHTCKSVRDTWFSTLVFPQSLLVFSLYWGIRTWNKELINPPDHLEQFLTHRLSQNHNHMLHTWIIGWSLLETLLTTLTVPRKRVGLIAVYSFSAAYTAWSHVVYLMMGKFPYPILDKLSAVQRVVFIAVCNGFMFLFFIGTRALQKHLGRKEKQE